MGLFQKTYIYVFVCFPNGKHPYVYRTADRSITINTVVMVPAGDEIRPAIVTGVREYREKDVPYPLGKTKMILGKADRKTARAFRGIDMRMPLRRDPKTKWIKEEHLWGDVTYRCLSCGARFRDPAAFCPGCGAQAKGIKDDPVWVEEMEFYD